MRVSHSKNPAHIPALVMAHLKFSFELQKAGHGDLGLYGPHPDSSVFYIKKKGDIIAFMFFYATTENGFYISRSWVDPDYRRKGLYKKLWNAIVNLAAKEKRSYIQSSISTKNKAMRAAAKKRGSHEDMVVSIYTVQS